MSSTPRRVSLPLLITIVLPLSRTPAQQPPARRTLPAFASESALAAYFQTRDAAYRRRVDEARRRWEAGCSVAPRGVTRVRAAARPPGAPARTAVIAGRVMMATGSIAGANVYLADAAATTVTTDDGRYRLSVPGDRLVGRDSFWLRVRAIGYRPGSRLIAVAEGDSVMTDFELCADVNRLEEIVVSGLVGAEGAGVVSITNTQHAGVDEGGIVKLHGDHLVMLRRGRLFTVAVGGGALRPVAAVDAFAPDLSPRGAWYDELLVAGDRVVVVGYSYRRGGTEIGLFRLGRDGALTYEATYHLRSNDYYTSRNYASRLIGSRLIFYTPLYYGHTGILAALPSLRRWSADTARPWRRIAAPQRVYHPGDADTTGAVALHTVTVCDLARPTFDCDATIVVGPPGRVSYVSPQAAYVWMSAWRHDRRAAAPSLLVRLPLDGSAPTAIRAEGNPVDQFSFLESPDGHLNVLVRSGASGETMWSAERAGGDAALLRIPLDSFADGTGAAAQAMYRYLPAPAGYAFHNRFVGDHLLYGLGSGWDRPARGGAALYVVPWRGGAFTRVDLPHGADRIEAMGRDAVVIGANGTDLHFSGIVLSGPPALAQRWIMADAAQGETRSHGFFYRNDGEGEGVIGLPVRDGGQPGWRQLEEGSASVVFLRNRSRRFAALGTLHASAPRRADDACRASCVDWYGNARPVFLGTRVFALLGYELVEGEIAHGVIREVRRISYAPVRTAGTAKR